MDNNGNTPTVEQLQQIIVNQSALLGRRELAQQLGKQFGGDRDIYKEAGYPLDISFAQYYAKYRRQDIAKRIVKAAPQATWRSSPELLEGADPETAAGDTPFCDAWRECVTIEQDDQIGDAKTIWHFLQRADVMAGLGEYAVLLVGIKDGLDLDQPLKAGTTLGTQGLLYLSPYRQDEVEIGELETDPTQKRFGLPKTYKISIDSKNSKPVHWSRIIHIAEGLLSDEIHGEPRLEAPYNRLNDLEKILPGAAEAAWKLLYQGLIVSTKDGYKLADNDAVSNQVNEYIHSLRRVLELEGMDAQVMGGQMVDPSGLVDTNLDFISAVTNIPKRILLGSERGDLASSQDERNWASYIRDRQRNFAEPIILRPLVNRLIYAGVLPEPANGYVVKWPSLFEMSERDQAEVLDKRMAALERAIRSGLPLEFYLRKYEHFDDDEIKTLVSSPEYQARLAVLEMGLGGNG